MKITALYVYPIKGLRGIALPTAQIGPQGVRYDRVFMLFQRDPETGELKLKLQVGKFPRCALFSQELYPTATAVSGDGPAESSSDSDSDTENGNYNDNEHDSGSGTVIRVRYHPPEPEAEDLDVLEVPLEPDMAELEPVEVDLYGSRANAYFMGEQYDAWFSARFGFPSTLIYLGDGRRPVLGSLSPRSLLPPSLGIEKTATNGSSWFSSSIYSSVTSYLWGGSSNGGIRSTGEPEPDWLTFTDLAPFLVTSEASLQDLQGRIAAGLMNGAAAEKGDPECAVEVENFMYKFRPNIVVDGETAWAEDFWSELGFFSSSSRSPTPVPGEELLRIALTTNCGRCASINVDYRTGKPAKGELGTVLKKMMRDRRIDPGHKYAPVFGRYGFVVGPHVDRAGGFVNLAVGDDVDVTKRATERTIFDWPGMATL